MLSLLLKRVIHPGDHMRKAPKSDRVIIGIIGRRNAGKSSLINALVGQEIAIVSDVPGTTTDPVDKHYELLPFGPVTFYDTPGLDDEGYLGELRVRATKKVLTKCDIALVVVDERGLSNFELDIIKYLRGKNLPFIVVFNKRDLRPPSQDDISFCINEGIPYVAVSSRSREGVDELKRKVIEIIPDYLKKEALLVQDLINPGDIVVMVVPIDLSAPKGRLILPQVQVLRSILDANGIAVVMKESELEKALHFLKSEPSLVITDSQVIGYVSKVVPEDIRLTTFSIIMARHKSGDLGVLLEGLKTIDYLEDGDRVLIAEACSHHPLEDDIGRVKIPRWITSYTGKRIYFDVIQGGDFPEDLEKYRLVIHCGACMLNPAEMRNRIGECKRRGVPITNYGMCISKVHGSIERVLKPFLKNKEVL
ncbi:MAG: [FeFe] hydrogenase H-cluster maturation GTPase HydF [candidate division WOR-3 bacterium]